MRRWPPKSAGDLQERSRQIKWLNRKHIEGSMRQLVLYEEFSRQEVHGIFAPDTEFTPQAGTWGLHGNLPIPHRPGGYVFFVTFGQSQGEHAFDEGITEDGILSWQSQPQQDRIGLQGSGTRPSRSGLRYTQFRSGLCETPPPRARIRPVNRC
jgi:hypothetical protein